MKTSAIDKPAIVYMARNRRNGKRYIGVTTRTNLRRRESEHVCAARRGDHNGSFLAALRKYGRKQFEWIILARCNTAIAALKKEVRLIEALKPEYNSTKGGDFWKPISQETIEKLREIHRGNKYRLGVTHSAETKRILSKSTKRKWKTSGNPFRGRDGWKFQQKPVVCLDDGRIFPSASAAAREYRLSKSGVITVCGRHAIHKTIGGLVFRYFGDHFGGKDEADAVRSSIYSRRRNEGASNQVAVQCIDDGKTYRSYQRAADAYGLDPISISCVCRGLRGRKTAGGLRFQHAPAPSTNSC